MLQLLGSLLLLASAAAPGTAYRSAGSVAGTPFEIEIRELDRAATEAAITEAFAAAARVEGDFRILASLLGGGGDVALSDGALALLERSQAYCLWSGGAVSALGGPVFDLWGLTRRAPGLPSAAALDAAVAAARCDRLALDKEARSARLAAGSEIHLFPLAQGWAADALLEAVLASGATNAWIRVGVIQKGVGPGPDGKGWPIDPPAVPGADGPVSSFFLRDRAVAILAPTDRVLEVGGEHHPAYVDLATGRPPEAIAQVLVVAERGLDAQAIGYAMFALGSRRGQFRLGGLEPPPSVLWQIGRGEGPPLLTESNWWKVPKR